MLIPFLLSISFVLSLYLQNIREVSLTVLPIPLVAALIISFAVFFLSQLILGNKTKAVLFSSIFIVLFFSFGEMLAKTRTGQNPVLLLSFSILILLLLIKILRATKRRLKSFGQFVFLVAVIAFLIPLVRIVDYELRQRIKIEVRSKLAFPSVEKNNIAKNLPDIYYLVPDSYTSPSVSQKFFKFDNSEFIAFLKNSGFYVASESTSNYPKTFLSLASTFSMEYLDYLSVFRNSSDQTVVNPLIKNGNVIKFLRSIGYRFYQMGSWWEITHYNSYADANFLMENNVLQTVSQFSYLALESTMLYPVIKNFLPNIILSDSEDDKRARILYQFAQIPKLVSLPGPKFVFVHILAPHDPYVFDKDCKFVNSRQIADKSEEKNYSNQVFCLNKKLGLAIATVIKNSSRPPVIVLQSDEGAPFLKKRTEPEDSWEKADNLLLKQKFPILAAYYLPGVKPNSLYPSITPVNTFRMVFDLYFSTKFPLLPDKNYIFKDLNNLYDFKEVTNIVK